MTESLNRQSAEIIPFPSRRRAPVYGIDTRALEAEAAKYRSAIDTAGWYHEEAIDNEHDHTGASLLFAGFSLGSRRRLFAHAHRLPRITWCTNRSFLRAGSGITNG